MKPFVNSFRALSMTAVLLGSVAALHAQNTITANPAVVFLNATVGGGPVLAPVQVTSAPTAVIAVSPSTNVPWLTFAATSTNTPTTISFIGNPAGLTAGVYNTVVNLSSASATTTPVQVVFTVNAASPLSANPPNLQFSYSQGSLLPGAQTIAITSGSPLSYNVTSNVRWLLFSGVSGQTPGTLTVGVDPSGLAPGTYIGTITITPANAAPALQVPVVFFVSGSPTLTVSPGSLTFNYQIGGSSNTTQKNLTLSSSGTPLGFNAIPSVNPNPGSVQWLSVSPTSGTTPATLAVSVTPGALPAGTYVGTITLNSPGSSSPSQNIQVTLNVSTQPLLDLSTKSLNFSYQIGGTLPSDQTVIPNATTANLNYTIGISTNDTGNWLTVAPASGVTPGAVTVGVNPVGLPQGNYTGSVTFNAAGGGNNPQVVQVFLTVSNNPTLSVGSSTLLFNYQVGQSPPAAQTVSVSSTGAALPFSVSSSINTTSNNVTWLLVGPPSSQTTPGTFSVGVSPTGMAPGTYSGQIVLTSPGAANPNPSPGCPGTLCIAVTLNVSNTALLSANPSSLSFSTQLGGSPSPQNITINSTGEAVNYTLTGNVISPSGGSWLSLGQTNGMASSGSPSSFFVGALSQSLTAGVYKATITVHPSNGNPDVIIPVTLSVSLGNLIVSPATMNFSQAGGTPPGPQAINISSTGAILSFSVIPPTVNWLTVTPTTGNTPGQVMVSVNGAGLQPGNYSATLNVVAQGAGNSPQPVTVNFTVGGGANFSLSPTSLSFASQVGDQNPPSAQTVALTLSAGSQPFTATASVNAPQGGNWLKVNPTSGTASTTATTLSISVDPTGLNPGTYSATVTVTSPNVSNSPQTVNVTYTVSPAGSGGGPATRILAQFAFGGGWYTALYFTNTTASPISFTISFTGDNGQPLSVPSLGGSNTTVNLPPRGTAILEAPDVGPLNQGYVSAALPAGVTGYGVFRQTTDRGVQEAVVPLSGTTTTTSTMIFDETKFITGVAIVNISGVDSIVSVVVRDNQGNTIGATTIPLAAKHKMEAALHDLPGLSVITGKIGSIDFSVNTGNLAVLGLRFSATGIAFTSIPTADR